MQQTADGRFPKATACTRWFPFRQWLRQEKKRIVTLFLTKTQTTDRGFTGVHPPREPRHTQAFQRNSTQPHPQRRPPQKSPVTPFFRRVSSQKWGVFRSNSDGFYNVSVVYFFSRVYLIHKGSHAPENEESLPPMRKVCMNFVI